MIGRKDTNVLTLAGASNSLPLVPWAYEHIWRPRSLGILTGGRFTVAQEIALLKNWLGAQPGELIVDLGSSTGLYARGTARAQPDATIVAVDMAPEMLKAGQRHARGEGVTNITHIRAPVQQLPFADASVDALVCGGSLNEFPSMDEALREARRVVRPGGRLFAMSLLNATSLAGRIGQWAAGLSGIRFPMLQEYNLNVERTGWACERQQVYGVVVFTLLRPVLSPSGSRRSHP